IAGVGGDVMFVHQAGVKSSHQRAAVLDVKLQQIRFAPSQQLQGRSDDDFVFGQILGRPREIDGDVPVVQRVVEELNVLAQMEMFVGLLDELQVPIVVVAE